MSEWQDHLCLSLSSRCVPFAIESQHSTRSLAPSRLGNPFWCYCCYICEINDGWTDELIRIMHFITYYMARNSYTAALSVASRHAESSDAGLRSTQYYQRTTDVATFRSSWPIGDQYRTRIHRRAALSDIAEPLKAFIKCVVNMSHWRAARIYDWRSGVSIANTNAA